MRSVASVRLSVSLSPFIKRKTARAINIKVGRDLVHGRPGVGSAAPYDCMCFQSLHARRKESITSCVRVNNANDRSRVSE